MESELKQFECWLYQKHDRELSRMPTKEKDAEIAVGKCVVALGMLSEFLEYKAKNAIDASIESQKKFDNPANAEDYETMHDYFDKGN